MPQQEKADANASQKQVFGQLNQLILNEPNLKGAIAGISVRSAKSGEILYQHAGDVRLRPASNLKLITAATALSALGENHQFSTEILTDGKLEGNKLIGNLYLKGKGDPTLLQEDLDLLAKKIKNSGVDVIFGNVIADDTWYDDERYSMDLTWSDETYYYGSAVSGLTASPNKDYDSGTIIVEVSPGKKAGTKAVISLQPSSNYIKIINNTKTVQKEEKKDISIIREHGENVITIEGTIPVHAIPIQEWMTVWEPTGYALDLFKQSLAKQGIHVMGTEGIAKTPDKAALLVSDKSIPLNELLIPFMKLSNNGHGETLVKEMGRARYGEGSWEKGINVVKEELRKIGVDPSSMVIRDGSGISHVNLVSANDISKFLYSAQNQEWFPTFLHSLPIAGNSERLVGGSLRYRLKNPEMAGKVKAKTGTITTVSSLSGYLKTRSGEDLIFSILLNNLMNDAHGKPIEDKIVTLLYEY
ncbi:D-alanyl-D-alanine carboxypeptidase/D-alanyl-D-alanine-endopeptidase [Fredinandcohnia sp. QZ13]|uniref:D-alanyl-D-alanine carboxypeptidase/D-alanyl-D-alanine endopeptidase n=1 Tax=Fredinandcohnia sp. QZ13 TaxID=3073144 RepID=UPI0028534996|nr:D-alanyl-D-alanine carboxypeptidase/D-alanyl-D-alanine-endopeptidase [Fredinandcohnia sp. QZ13]MDR4886157.1 D-alanyl-D-alanine carboxypeptidase/D-alanyl-D-alanine-endopeptidase [Fredinandcohnia sp. QZ13]